MLIVKTWKEFYDFLTNNQEPARDFLEQIEKFLFHRLNGYSLNISLQYTQPPIKVFYPSVENPEQRVFFNFYALNPEIVYRNSRFSVYITISQYYNFITNYITEGKIPMYDKNILNIHPIFYDLMKTRIENRVRLIYHNFPSHKFNIYDNQKYIDKIITNNFRCKSSCNYITKLQDYFLIGENREILTKIFCTTLFHIHKNLNFRIIKTEKWIKYKGLINNEKFFIDYNLDMIIIKLKRKIGFYITRYYYFIAIPELNSKIDSILKGNSMTELEFRDLIEPF